MLRSKLAAFRRSLALLGLCAVAAVPLMAPSTAHAYWYRGYWRPGIVIGAPVLVAPPPYYVAPPRVVVRGPYPRYWVPGHYDYRGYFIRGHWA